MIKNVLLDLDDTLLDFHKAEAVALTKTLTEIGILPTSAVLERYSDINRAQWELLELKKLTRPEVKVRRYRLLFEELGVTFPAEQAARLYEGFLSQGHYFTPGTEALLPTLHGKYRLYLVSNGSVSVQSGRLDSAGIRPFFDGIFLSEAVGADKPDVAFFDHCFNHIPDFQREETVIVGDSLTSDILGGINAEIATVWYNPHQKKNSTRIRPQHEISHLDELPALLATLSD